MKNFDTKQLTSTVLPVFLVLVIAYFAFIAYAFSIKHVDDLQHIANSNKIENKIPNYISGNTRDLGDSPMKFMRDSFGKLTNTQPNSRSADYSIAKNEDKVNLYTLLFVVAIVVLLLTYYSSSKEVFLLTILTASIIAWLVGIFAPIMTMEVGKNLPVLGHTVFIFEAKGIWNSIEKLWHLDNYIVAILIVIFSLTIPIVKTISLYISVLRKSNIGFIELIGKWSMADVFVMSILLATMSLNTDEMTDARIHVALYFFAIYVILSMIASSIIHKEYSKHD